MAWSVDWEGSFILGRYHWKESVPYSYTVMIVIANTRKDLLEKFMNLVGYGTITIMRKEGAYHNSKQCYRWQIASCKHIKEFCKDVLPFLVAKRQQASLLLEFVNRRLNTPGRVKFNRYDTSDSKIRRTEREAEIYQEIKLLNKRGI